MRKPSTSKSSPSEVFLEKGVLKICSKFTGEHPCRSVISMKLQSNFIEITFRHGCCNVNLLLIFRTSFLKNTPLECCFIISLFSKFIKRVYLAKLLKSSIDFPKPFFISFNKHYVCLYHYLPTDRLLS